MQPRVPSRTKARIVATEAQAARQAKQDSTAATEANRLAAEKVAADKLAKKSAGSKFIYSAWVRRSRQTNQTDEPDG